MKILGFEIIRRKELLPLSGYGRNGWFPVLESSTGAFQKNLLPASKESVLAFSAVYACITLIAGDVSKLRVMLMENEDDGTWQDVANPAVPFLAVLRKPNDYQTRVQFVMHWITSKLIHGNAYTLKERDQRGLVTELYTLDPCSVTPLVSDAGEVFYRLRKDNLAGIEDSDTIVPASEIIHDRVNPLWHPLVGVSPIYACGLAALQGLAIQGNSEHFFANMSRPSGVLTAPGKIADETAKRIKETFETGFGGKNIGHLAVVGDGLKYEPMTIPATDAQLIEQLKWTVEDVARCFHVPPYKLGLNTNVTFSNAGQLDQDYYSQCLQVHLESFEALMDDGLSLPAKYRTEFDIDGLMRMDPGGQAEADAKEVTGAIKAPNEARKKRNLRPVKGGDKVLAQRQMWPLDLLGSDIPAATPAAAPSASDVARAVADNLLPALAERKSEIVVNIPADPIKDFSAAVLPRLDAIERRDTQPAIDSIKELCAAMVGRMDSMERNLETRQMAADEEGTEFDAFMERLTRRFEEATFG